MGNEKNSIRKKLAVILSFSITAEVIAFAVVSDKLGIKKKLSSGVKKLLDHTPDSIKRSEVAAPASLAAAVLFNPDKRE